MLKEPGRTLVFTLSQDAGKKGAIPGDNAEIITLPAQNRDAMILPALEYLARREEINEVLVEAGAILNGALLQAGLIDELVIYMAPHILGQDARGLFNIPAIEEMNKRVTLKYEDIRMVGQDVRITLKPVTSYKLQVTSHK